MSEGIIHKKDHPSQVVLINFKNDFSPCIAVWLLFISSNTGMNRKEAKNIEEEIILDTETIQIP